MKKTFLTIFAVLIVVTFASCSLPQNTDIGKNDIKQPTESNDLTKKDPQVEDSTNNNDSTKTDPPVEHPTKNIDINEYMRIVVGYFHEPYRYGDDVSDKSLLSLCFRVCLSNSDILDFVSKDTDQQMLGIGGKGIRNMAKILANDDVDIRNYHTDMEYTSDVYLNDLDKYIVSYARGYWNEDPYYLVESIPLQITETMDTSVVIATVSYIPHLGADGVERQLKYSFSKVIDNGVLYYRIMEIEII